MIEYIVWGVYFAGIIIFTICVSLTKEDIHWSLIAIWPICLLLAIFAVPFMSGEHEAVSTFIGILNAAGIICLTVGNKHIHTSWFVAGGVMIVIAWLYIWWSSR
jgi:hypothetical protein